MHPNWLNPGLKSDDILGNKYLKIGFSQHYEDWYVISKFWGPILRGFTGTYLDLGCYHPQLYSNTKILSALGWMGFAVDASPFIEKVWNIDRPKDIFYNFAITPYSSHCEDSGKHIQKLYVFEDGAYNTTNADVARSVVGKGVKILGYVDVPTINLDELASLIRRDLAVDRIDYCSIDLEGVDLNDCICDFLNRLGCPLVLTIELPTVHEKDQSVFKLLKSSFVIDIQKIGYTLESYYSSNLFLCHEDLKKLGF